MISPKELIEWLKTTWNYELFHLGENPFTTKTFLLLVLSLFLLFYISSKIRRILVNKIFPRYDLDTLILTFWSGLQNSSTVQRF